MRTLRALAFAYALSDLGAGIAAALGFALVGLWWAWAVGWI